MLRLAMCEWANPRAWAIRCAARRVSRRPQNKTDGAMFMTPTTGRPSSSVAHGSAHTPPGAAATYSTMSELATPLERCSAGTVKRLQTLPVANWGTTNGRSSGWTSRRSACSLTAAGTTLSMRIFLLLLERASPRQS
ncbi:regulator of sigma E protease [Trypanosoma cruzi]|nr:regulator of sigma E protease [Trypanosoma cruzi]